MLIYSSRRALRVYSTFTTCYEGSLSRSAVFKLLGSSGPSPPFVPSLLLLLLLICLWISICHFVSPHPPWSLISPSSHPRLTLVSPSSYPPVRAFPALVLLPVLHLGSFFCSCQLYFALTHGPLGPSAYCLMFNNNNKKKPNLIPTA